MFEAKRVILDPATDPDHLRIESADHFTLNTPVSPPKSNVVKDSNNSRELHKDITSLKAATPPAATMAPGRTALEAIPPHFDGMRLAKAPNPSTGQREMDQKVMPPPPADWAFLRKMDQGTREKAQRILSYLVFYIDRKLLQVHENGGVSFKGERLPGANLGKILSSIVNSDSLQPGEGYVLHYLLRNRGLRSLVRPCKRVDPEAAAAAVASGNTMTPNGYAAKLLPGVQNMEAPPRPIPHPPAVRRPYESYPAARNITTAATDGQISKPLPPNLRNVRDVHAERINGQMRKAGATPVAPPLSKGTPGAARLKNKTKWAKPVSAMKLPMPTVIKKKSSASLPAATARSTATAMKQRSLQRRPRVGTGPLRST